MEITCWHGAEVGTQRRERAEVTDTGGGQRKDEGGERPKEDRKAENKQPDLRAGGDAMRWQEAVSASVGSLLNPLWGHSGVRPLQAIGEVMDFTAMQRKGHQWGADGIDLNTAAMHNVGSAIGEHF